MLSHEEHRKFEAQQLLQDLCLISPAVGSLISLLPESDNASSPPLSTRHLILTMANGGKLAEDFIACNSPTAAKTGFLRLSRWDSMEVKKRKLKELDAGLSRIRLATRVYTRHACGTLNLQNVFGNDFAEYNHFIADYQPDNLEDVRQELVKHLQQEFLTLNDRFSRLEKSVASYFLANFALPNKLRILGDGWTEFRATEAYALQCIECDEGYIEATLEDQFNKAVLAGGSQTQSGISAAPKEYHPLARNDPQLPRFWKQLVVWTELRKIILSHLKRVEPDAFKDVE